MIGAVKGGVPPSISDLYDDPALAAAYPFAKEIKASLATAAVRPLTPAYQNLSIVISHARLAARRHQSPEHGEEHDHRARATPSNRRASCHDRAHPCHPH